RHISVTGLFGVFDHEIPLNEDSRITIIHGLNGYGKTVILQMIYGALRNDYKVFWFIPFKRFEMRLSDERILRVEQEGLQLWHPETWQSEGLRVPQRLNIKLISDGAPPRETVIGFQVAQAVADWIEELRRSLRVRLVQTERLGAVNSDGQDVPAVTK